MFACLSHACAGLLVSCLCFIGLLALNDCAGLLVMLVLACLSCLCWLACLSCLCCVGLLAYHACVCLLVMVVFACLAFGLSCFCWLAYHALFTRRACVRVTCWVVSSCFVGRVCLCLLGMNVFARHVLRFDLS